MRTINEERPRCIYCGQPLAWDSSDQASDLYAEYDEDATIDYWHCTHCGRDYEIVEPTLEERTTNYKDYWA